MSSVVTVYDMEWVAMLGAAEDKSGDFDHVVGINANGWAEAVAAASRTAAPGWIVLDVFQILSPSEQEHA